MATAKNNGNGTTARHRAGDPSTSRLAAAFIREHLPNLEYQVFAKIKRSGQRGRTLDELVDEIGLDKVTISPRMRPLCDKKLILESEDRRLGKSGRLQTVWKPVRRKPKRKTKTRSKNMPAKKTARARAAA